jgi:hypothetical protein
MDSVKIVNDLRNSTRVEFQTLPQNEKAVRPLVNLAPEDRQTVWEQSCQKANGHPTAEEVQLILGAQKATQRGKHLDVIWHCDPVGFVDVIRSKLNETQRWRR